MSPFNLEDIEKYLVEQLDKMPPAERMHFNIHSFDTSAREWLRARFHELRAREKALLDE